MAPGASWTTSETTLYGILSLNQTHLEGEPLATQQKAIKQAYHKALLKHHPDKNSTPSTSSPSETPFTIDQIQHAYNVLSDARQRREYDRELLLNNKATGQKGQDDATRFQTGIETVDLDELEYDEANELFYGPCRCGNDRGFQCTEVELAAHEEDGVLTVQCLDCTIFRRILFQVEEE